MPHLIYWNENWQLRYKENQVNAVPAVSINANTFLIGDGETFLSLKEKLLEILLHWQKILDLDQLISTVNGFPEKAEWWAILSNTATHHANHIGQIFYIGKMKKRNQRDAWIPFSLFLMDD